MDSSARHVNFNGAGGVLKSTSVSDPSAQSSAAAAASRAKVTRIGKFNSFFLVLIEKMLPDNSGIFGEPDHSME
ncbi:unnamed protein product [Phytophthora lilii]|uniref:Unnamed protein product n=1 Tax=Phytophthora lilii TaxID=2077276 RepID=A0A9W7CSU3_9STRA|nr:unnamed protein product [Phytophthora lilii]